MERNACVLGVGWHSSVCGSLGGLARDHEGRGGATGVGVIGYRQHQPRQFGQRFCWFGLSAS